GLVSRARRLGIGYPGLSLVEIPWLSGRQATYPRQRGTGIFRPARSFPGPATVSMHGVAGQIDGEPDGDSGVTDGYRSGGRSHSSTWRRLQVRQKILVKLFEEHYGTPAVSVLPLEGDGSSRKMFRLVGDDYQT